VVAVLGVDCGRTEDRVSEEMLKLQQIKQRAYNFFGIAIKKMMREEAIRRGMINPETGSVVNRFSEIGKEFATIVCDRSARALFDVCFAVFDLTPNWDVALETDFMVQEDLKYTEIQGNSYILFRRGRPAGTGLLSIMHDKKSEIVKLVMKKARRSHGYYISIRMLSDGTGVNRIRRRGGVYYSKFLVRDKVISSSIVNEENCSWKNEILTNNTTESVQNCGTVLTASTDTTESLSSTDAISVSSEKTDLLVSSESSLGAFENDFQWSDDISIFSGEATTEITAPVIVKPLEEEGGKKREERSEKLVERKKNKDLLLQKQLRLEEELAKARSELEKLRKVRIITLKTYFLMIHF